MSGDLELLLFNSAYVSGICRVPDEGHAGDLWSDLLEELQPFPFDLVSHGARPCDVPTGPAEAGHELIPHGISTDRHDDGDRTGRLLGRTGPRRAHGHNDIHWEADEFGHQIRKAFKSSLRPPVLNGDVLSLTVAEFAEPLPEGLDNI